MQCQWGCHTPNSPKLWWLETMAQRSVLPAAWL
jgi:hypothetical protein